MPVADAPTDLYLAHETWTLWIEPPTRKKELHCHRIVTGCGWALEEERMCSFNGFHVRFHAEAGSLRERDLSVDDGPRVARKAISILPNPMCIYRGYVTNRGSGSMGKHGEGDVKVIVGV